MTCLPNNYMDAHIIFGVNSVLNDNTCAPSIDALRTTHGDNINDYTSLIEINCYCTIHIGLCVQLNASRFTRHLFNINIHTTNNC